MQDTGQGSEMLACPYFKFISTINITEMKKFKFSRDFVHGNKKVDKKGSTKVVTSRHAAFLEANKFGSIEGDAPLRQAKKEDKEAEKRETK